MRVCPSECEVCRAKARRNETVFGAMAIGTVWVVYVVGIHCLLGWW